MARVLVMTFLGFLLAAFTQLSFCTPTRHTFTTTLRCNPKQIGYNTGTWKCPENHFCAPEGLCHRLPPEPVGGWTLEVMRPEDRYQEASLVTSQVRCGRDFGNIRCNSNNQEGTCCSAKGYCGSTSVHCLKENGCQYGCQNPPNPPTMVLRQSSNQGHDLEDQSHARPAIPSPRPAIAPRDLKPTGEFKVVGDSGVPVMHAALMPNGKVVFLDKIENYTQLKLDNGEWAYSAEWDPDSGKLTPLAYKTNAFCCGGSFLASGTLVSVGGNGPLTYISQSVTDGFAAIRYLTREQTGDGTDGDDWFEPGNSLASRRWYASAQTMPDGTVFVASGSLNGLDLLKDENNNPTYEILDRSGLSSGVNFAMEILEKNQPYYLYPFLHLLPDGSLFVFTSKSSQLFDVGNDKIIKTLPDLEGMHRTYPNTGGSVLLPLSSANGYDPEVMICGGGQYQDLSSPTDKSCGRLKLMDQNPEWEKDDMPEGRCMVEGTLLPDGTVLWLNGAQRGAQGFGIADQPAYDALIYDPEAKHGERWTTAGTSKIARLYHSVALLLLDGTVAVTGSNPNEMPILEPDLDPNNPTRAFPTEFRIEIYTPPYLMGEKAHRRPQDIVLSSHSLSADGSSFTASFTAPEFCREVKVALYHGGFVTHGLHMGQRMIWLDAQGWKPTETEQKLQVFMPKRNWGSKVVPPGPYVVYIVVDRTPGVGQFVQVG